jgi:predicted glycoside hydrolase/deacetylase ChbG (UPF0249 family)
VTIDGASAADYGKRLPPPTPWPPARSRTTPADRKRLVINADDFGLTPAVNLGIEEAHEAGCVTSASLLVNLPGFEDAVERARSSPTLGIGLHVNLTAGAPIAGADAVPTLCDPRTGAFRSLRQLAARALAGRIAPHDVMAECTAQIARLRNAGISITHVDAHRHVHLLPGIRRPFLEAVRRAGIQVVRLPLEQLRHTLGSSSALAEQVVLRLVHRLAGSAIAPRRVADFRGSALLDRARVREGILQIIDTLEPGLTELMVHPGYWDAGIEQWDRYTWQRERELRGLIDPAVRQRLARSDIELVHFGALAPARTPVRARPSRGAPRFSVVIPAYNEARYLPRLLDSIDVARAAYGASPSAIEVIVADNASTDRTAAIAAERGCRVAHQPKRVISAVRNAGAAVARGQVLAFIDADSELHPNTFDAIDQALHDDVIGGATGVTMDRWSSGIVLIFTIQELAGRLTGWDTGVVFCRRADFETVGGYDENVLYSEDFAFYGTLRRLARTRRQRFVRLHGVRAVTSARKFEQFGNLKWPLANLAVLGLSAIHARRARALIERYWYRARA